MNEVSVIEEVKKAQAISIRDVTEFNSLASKKGLYTSLLHREQKCRE